ncbi:MAG: bifunctional adenosylcobinamide kinase/adenosylcobinamide-phosphate guanylyltransferase, partial [Comamonadaceae bacterium]|nr:bifunctional adenosylcobinamide kinase/adenosylcobinamide-phosphate guanylyltransferase [Comamonadaceae bacterium]
LGARVVFFSPLHDAALPACDAVWLPGGYPELHAEALATLEEPRDLAGALARHGTPETLVVVDCLTLWLTHWLMPAAAAPEYEPNRPPAQDWQAQAALFFEAIRQTPGPVVLVGNEIGLGVIPMGREVRAFVDALGALNQQVAQACERVTLMAAGLPLTLKAP